MDGFPTGLLFDEAMKVVGDIAAQSQSAGERLPLSHCHGRVLAEDIHASIPLPPFDNSAMDGFALRHADLGADETALRLVGEQFAGVATGQVVQTAECMRITTGAPLPAGADTVEIKENCRVDGDRVIVPGRTPAGANVRLAGEDVRAGDLVLRAGELLNPARVSLAASLGIAAVLVARRPRVAVLTTGDELVAPGNPLLPGQIFDSNGELLLGLLRADGIEPALLPRLPDDPARAAHALLEAAAAHDLIITAGGVSAGEKDYLPDVLGKLGSIHFWKVRMKPGMPLLFGRLGRAHVLGLPGNPVSVLATFLTFARTLLDGLQGRAEPRPRWHAQLVAPLEKTHARREFIRGRLFGGDNGVLHVEANPATGSHRLRAAADSNALIAVPEGPQRYAAGSVVEVLPL